MSSVPGITAHSKARREALSLRGFMFLLSLFVWSMDGLSESLSTSTWTWNLPVSSDIGVEETGLQSRFVWLCFRTVCICFLMQVSVALSYFCLFQVGMFLETGTGVLVRPRIVCFQKTLKAGPPVQRPGGGFW